jgi:hypothetical protein
MLFGLVGWAGNWGLVVGFCSSLTFFYLAKIFFVHFEGFFPYFWLQKWQNGISAF